MMEGCMKKVVVALVVVFALCCSLYAADPDLITYSDLRQDGKIKAFIDEYLDGTPVEVYVREVDDISNILFFSYDNDYGQKQEAVIIYYSDGSYGGVDCSEFSATMFYSSTAIVPEQSIPDALFKVNVINQSSLESEGIGTIYIDEEGYICSVFNVYLDGVTNMGEFLFWNFWDFEYYSQRMAAYVIKE